MQKRWIPLFFCLTMLLCLIPAAAAEMPKIVDDAGLLTQEEIDALEEKAQALTGSYDMDVVIVTVWSLDGKSSEAYADDYFDYNGYGIGEDHSGVLLLLSMEYRDWAISTCGETIYALTDYDIESVFSEIAGYLSEDEYYEAFNAYLDALEPYFQSYMDGDPIDGYIYDYDGPGSYEPGTQEDFVYYLPDNRQATGFTAKRLLISFVIGAAVAAVVIFVMRSQMNTAKPQDSASSYLKAGSYDLRRRQDIFLYSNVTKTYRSDNNNAGHGGGGSHGGGSSVHTSSSGSSHGGGHGKF